MLTDQFLIQSSPERLPLATYEIRFKDQESCRISLNGGGVLNPPPQISGNPKENDVKRLKDPKR